MEYLWIHCCSGGMKTQWSMRGKRHRPLRGVRTFLRPWGCFLQGHNQKINYNWKDRLWDTKGQRPAKQILGGWNFKRLRVCILPD